MKTIERAAYSVGGLLILSGVIHGVVLLTSGGAWEGPLSLRKPTTFGLSFGLTLINVTFIASFVALKDSTRTLLLGLFAAAAALETLLVSLQAWRGVPSHFNVETSFDAAVAQALAVGGFTIVAIVVVLTVAAFRDGMGVWRPFRLAIRAGLLALVAAQIAGGIMIGTGMQLVFTGEPQRAYTTGGWLKPAHAVMMHGILVLPLLAWLASRTDWEERTKTLGVSIGIAVLCVDRRCDGRRRLLEMTWLMRDISGTRLLVAVATSVGLAAAAGLSTAYGLPRLAPAWGDANRLAAVIVLEVYLAIIVGHGIAFDGLRSLRRSVRLRATTSRQLFAALAVWVAVWAAAAVLYLVLSPLAWPLTAVRSSLLWVGADGGRLAHADPLLFILAAGRAALVAPFAE